MSDNPILRPVVKSLQCGMGKERLRCFWWDWNPIFPLARDALTRLSYQFDNQSAAAHSKWMTDKERVGNPAIWRLGRDLNPLILSDFTDNPNSTARRKWRTRWESNPCLPNFFGCSNAVELRGGPVANTTFRVATIGCCLRRKKSFCDSRFRWARSAVA